MADAIHETRLSEKTVSAIYHTLREMLCDFMLLRNENVHLGGPDLSGLFAEVCDLFASPLSVA